MTEKNTELPQYPEPYWRSTLSFPSFSKLETDITTDVLIVGGGITGITSAYLLAKQGVKVTLIEASEILNGTTGHTTAKITAQHGLIYDQLITDHGEEKARLYYEANTEGMELIKGLIEEHSIECNLNVQDAYVYANTDEYKSKIQEELKAYQKLGIRGDYAEKIPFSIPCKAAVIMKDQAQFHPLKYLTALIPPILEAGGNIYERTTAMKIEDGKPPTVKTETGHIIKSNHIIVASHFPFNDEMGLYFARTHIKRSYVLGIKTEQEYPGGMYYSADNPTRSLRYTEDNGEKLILVGGEGHKTGQGISTIEHYEALQDFSSQYFNVKDIPYRWSAQDIVTPDNLPFVGPVTSNHPNVLIATGYAKWGMTNGSIAAKILSDHILQKDNRYADLYNPARIKGMKNIVEDNADVAKHLIKSKLAVIHKTPEDLGIDEGAIVKVNGDKAGCYRDHEGQLHIVDSTCTHMGCEVAWNSGDRTWDCPCHASRYSITGEVLNGPAVEPLKKIQ
ncbi:FAD-dependent oxidoreductase [Peribacillus butanolivorans]|uniref:FAD-dependent oxidoreductase n=1 Tax=Peribacillus butanolivorans TaxID=421767 RepID=UPI00207C855E|nr:FAD-dependent oxidoreductase [Peribacillus butanolivorans]MCO0596070.1 FAD-dependent oxidoreductase [Peribacillus butanolivorans]